MKWLVLLVALLGSAAGCRFDANGVDVGDGGGIADGSLVETVPQAANDAVHLHLAARAEDHIKEHFAFEFELARFFGIGRARLGEDFNGLNRVRARGGDPLGGFDDFGGIAEARGLHGTLATAAGRLNGNVVAEAGAGDSPAQAAGSAGAVAVARAAGQIKLTFLGDIGALAGIARAGNAVGVAESAGLYLLGTDLGR